MSDRPAERVLAAVRRELWAIEPGWLDTIEAIADRRGDPSAIGAHADASGRPSLRRVGPVAVVTIRGVMSRYMDLFADISGGSSTEVVSALVAEAGASDAAHIVIDIDSPGGSVFGISELAAQITALSQPTTAFVSGLGASAAAWVSVAADRVVASDIALLGSLGVITREPPGAEKADVFSTNAPKKAGSRAGAQRIADEIEAVMHQFVAERRGVTISDVRERFGQGDVLSAREALDAGLIDAIGTLDSVLRGQPAEKRPRAPVPDPPGGSMSNQQAGASAEHEAALAAAREEGRAAARAEAQAAEASAAETATAAERARVAGIRAAGEGVSTSIVMAVAEAGCTTEQASTIFAAVAAEPAAQAGAVPASVAALISDARTATDPRLALETGRDADEGDTVMAEAFAIIKAEEARTR